MARDFKIENYLTKRTKRGSNDYGECIHCKKVVEWRRERITNHISVCENATHDTKERFKNLKKRKVLSQISTDYTNFSESIFPEDSASAINRDAERPSKIYDHFRVLTDDFIERLDLKVLF